MILNKIKGIYKIENKVNGKVYIGESLDIERRWNEHREDLDNNKHHSFKLQNDWNKYGEDNFKFEVIKEIDKDMNSFISMFALYVYEDKYIKQYDSFNNGYNCEMSLDKVLSGEKKISAEVKTKDKDMMRKVLDNINKNNGIYIQSEKAKKTQEKKHQKKIEQRNNPKPKTNNIKPNKKVISDNISCVAFEIELIKKWIYY